MRPDRVVVLAPVLDQHLGLLEGVEDLTIEQLIPELPIEALVLAVLPGAPRLDLEGLDAEPGEPVSNGLGGELRAIVRANVVRWAMVHKEICQDLQYII